MHAQAGTHTGRCFKAHLELPKIIISAHLVNVFFILRWGSTILVQFI